MSDQEFKLKNVLEKDQIKALLKAHTKSQLLEKAIAWEIMAGQYKKQLDDLQKDQESIDKERVEEFFKLNKDELQNEQDDKKED
jgi:phage host-nuclease inhibitor protein Gam|tara:strand:+ start:646 stop:897 length:252 start_codon:yes stop_codon:yes gene_type:complete